MLNYLSDEGIEAIREQLEAFRGCEAPVWPLARILRHWEYIPESRWLKLSKLCWYVFDMLYRAVLKEKQRRKTLTETDKEMFRTFFSYDPDTHPLDLMFIRLSNQTSSVPHGR